MKNLLKISRKIIILMLSFFPIFFVIADGAGTGIPDPLNAGSIKVLLGRILTAVIQLGIPVAALYLVYGGYLLVSAGGEAKQISEGKEAIRWAMIGIAVLIGAGAIVAAIQSTITGISK